LFSNPEKAHPSSEPRRLTYWTWKSVRKPGLWGIGRTPKKKHFAHTGKRNPILTTFCILSPHATFDDDRLRGLGVARGRISYFRIDLRRRPYNTLILLCECV